MPQGSYYDKDGKLIWKFDICIEFDCNQEYVKKDYGIVCGGDFTKKPCMFLGEHVELNRPQPGDTLDKRNTPQPTATGDGEID
jgi:hypothetical protein